MKNKSSSQQSTTNTTNVNIDNIIETDALARAVSKTNELYLQVSKGSEDAVKSLTATLTALASSNNAALREEAKQSGIFSDGFKVASVAGGVALGYAITKKRGKK